MPSAAYESGTEPITDQGLAELERKAWRRVGPPSLTYTLRVVTLQRLIARIRQAEQALKDYHQSTATVSTVIAKLDNEV